MGGLQIKQTKKELLKEEIKKGLIAYKNDTEIMRDLKIASSTYSKYKKEVIKEWQEKWNSEDQLLIYIERYRKFYVIPYLNEYNKTKDLKYLGKARFSETTLMNFLKGLKIFPLFTENKQTIDARISSNELIKMLEDDTSLKKSD